MPRQKLVYFRSKEKDEPLDEQKIIRESLKGDKLAFEKLVELYRNQIFWTIYHLVLDYEDARDVAQQTFIKVWKSLGEYDSTRAFKSWIHKVAANSAIDFLRTRKTNEPLPEDIAKEASSFDRDLDLRKIFAKVVPMLSERQRIVLVLREIDGMEIHDISELLDCTESTVRNLLSQAKESFRKKVKEYFPGYGL